MKLYNPVVLLVCVFGLGFFSGVRVSKVSGQPVDEHKTITEKEYNTGFYPTPTPDDP